MLLAERVQEQVRAVVEPLIDQRICAALGIQWQPNGAHVTEFNARAETNRAMREDWQRRRDDVAAVRKSLLEKVAGALLYAVGGMFGGGALFWLASKLGVKAP